MVKKKDQNGENTKDTVRAKRKGKSVSTQRYLPIAEVKHDTLLLKNGGLRAVLRVNSLNFNLKSETEQMGILAGYQAFLNTVTFPLQIVIRSSKLNIDPYLDTIRENKAKQKTDLLKRQAEDYAQFMSKLVDIADIMQKQYFIVVPVDSLTKAKRGLLQRFMEWMNVDDTRAKASDRARSFDSNSKILRDRITLVQSGLENIGITVERLKTEELVRLFYSIYNPGTSQKEGFKDLTELHTSPEALL
jgi:type IV secretory pathway VirB4 component